MHCPKSHFSHSRLFLVILVIVAASACRQHHEVWQTSDDFAAAFDTAGVEGTFVLHGSVLMSSRQTTASEPETRFLPASTFKIFNALVALETGVIPDEHATFKWDGVERSVPAWNQDHDLASAISVSAVWYFQELARRIGRERMQEWIDRAKYGNQNIGGEIDSFWLNGRHPDLARWSRFASSSASTKRISLSPIAAWRSSSGSSYGGRRVTGRSTARPAGPERATIR